MELLPMKYPIVVSVLSLALLATANGDSIDETAAIAEAKGIAQV